MEVRRRRGSIEIPTNNSSKQAGTVALRNFIIPRKKRVSGQALLEPCPSDSRDYTLIQSKLRDSRLDIRKEHVNAWLWKDVKLMHNDGFLKEFSEKRSEMRTKGRHKSEMEESFCFLVATYETTSQIYQFGLRIGSQDQYSLGKPSHGVYLFKHVDVALKHATASPCSWKNLIVFKVLFGKVKKVTPGLEWNKTVDPMVGFDCHMAKDTVSYRDSISQQVLGSSVFLFDYNENQELNKRPRQCLPYAVVSFESAISGTAPTSISPPVSPTKPPTDLIHGPLEHLKGCTVAKRTGKGDNATVTFKRFATQGCSGMEYQSQSPGAETNGVDSTQFQYSDLQTPSFTHQQPYIPYYYNNPEYFNSSLPYYDNGIPWQNYMDQPAFCSNIHSMDTTSVYGGNTDTLGVIPQTSAEKVSTIVYSSCLVKDPRLSRQETNIQKKTSGEVIEPDVPNEQGCQSLSQKQKENELTLSCEKQSLSLDEHKEGRFPNLSLDEASKSNPTAWPKTENMPSIKLFKMKFQKYGPYLKMTEEERHEKIWSRGNLTPEQKQLLLDRIHFYEIHYQRYKQGLLFQKDTETDTTFSLSHTWPQHNDVCPSTLQHSPLITNGNQIEVNQSHMRHPISASLSNFTPTTVLVDNERSKIDRQKSSNNSSDSQTESQSDGVAQSIEEKERTSEMCLGTSTMQSDNSENSKTSEPTNDIAQSLCPSTQVEINNQESHEIEIPTSPKETFSCKTTLSNTIEDCAEFEQHILAMEVANCVDILATDGSEYSDCSYVTAVEQVQDSQSSTENQDLEALSHSKSDTNSDMSIEVESGEAQHNTIYNALYERIQVDQLLSIPGENLFSNKPYLRPKGLDKSLVIPCHHVNEPMSKKEDLQLVLKMKSNQTNPERVTLSERFSKFRCLRRKLAAFVHVTKRYTAHLNGELKCKPEALMSCSDGGKGTVNSNAELIKLLAQRYNENRFVANCKRIKQKRSKVLCRKSSFSSAVSKRTLGQLPFRVQRKTKNIRKSQLLKAERKHRTSLALKMSSCGRASFSNLTSDSSNDLSCKEKTSDTSLNSAAESQSLSGSQNPSKPLNKESSRNDNATNISAEETYCVSSENKPRHGDDLSQTIGQCINSATKSTEIVYHDLSKNSNHNESKRSEENITSDSKDTEIIEEMKTDSGTDNNKMSHQEKFSVITCYGSNESGNGDSTEAGPKEEALLQKDLFQEDDCDTKEISPEYSVGKYEDTSSPFPPVSSVPSEITTGNVIGSCTANVQTVMTPDSPKVMNNETEIQTVAGILGDSALDNSGSSLTKNILSTNKSLETNGKLQDGELRNNPESTDAQGVFSSKEMSESDQDCLKALKDAMDNVVEVVTENTNHLSELASTSQSNPSLQDSKTIGIMNPIVKPTSDFHSTIIKDAVDLAEIKNNLHSAWQGEDINRLTNSSDTQIISKLRDYLTKFEFSVKKQDTSNNSVIEARVPTAWITLDSTAHKQQLHHTKHYSRQGVTEVTHRQSEMVHFQVAPTKNKQSKGDSQPNSSISKRRRTSNLERVSPDSTFTETVVNEPNPHLVSMDTQPIQTASCVPSVTHWLQSRGNKVQENQTICPQVLGNLSRPSGQQVNRSREQPCQINQSNEQTIYKKLHMTYLHNTYSVADISNTLKLADHAVSLTELGPLQSNCQRMLQYFIFNFEHDQKFSFHQSCISRNLILEKYLDHPPLPVELKFEAINSFLELQMMVEACQFVDNKISFLRRKPTFRSLLWYDPSLYGELYKGSVGFQQQSSLFSTFQQCLTIDDYRKLQEYYCAVSTLHQQLQDAPDTSYYMYLKTKRERLEIEAAFRNPSDVKTFFLSVPMAIMINLGDSMDVLKKTSNIVTMFIETPADQLPGTFDIGKAEHLSIICRYLQEKMLFLKPHKDITKLSWFGMEHLLYDASKVLVWNESDHGMPNEVLMRYNRLNSQTVKVVTEPCVAFVNKSDQSPQPLDMNITPPHQMNSNIIQSAGVSTERTPTALSIPVEDRPQEINQPPRRRATLPSPRSNFSDGVTPLIQTSLATQPGNSLLYTDYNQRSNTLQWRLPRTPAWDHGPTDAVPLNSHSEIRALLLSKRIPTSHTKPRTTAVTDLQNSHAVRQQQLSQPLIVKPVPVERSKAQPTISAHQHPDLSKEQANEFGMPIMTPFPFPCFSPDVPAVIPPPFSPLPFPSTSKQVVMHPNPTPISYPFFVFNGQTYSTSGSSGPVSAIHTETRYLPHPV